MTEEEYQLGLQNLEEAKILTDLYEKNMERRRTENKRRSKQWRDQKAKQKRVEEDPEEEDIGMLRAALVQQALMKNMPARRALNV